MFNSAHQLIPKTLYIAQLVSFIHLLWSTRVVFKLWSRDNKGSATSTVGIHRCLKGILIIYVIQLTIEPQIHISSTHLWKFSFISNHSQYFGLEWLLKIHSCLKMHWKCYYFLQHCIYVKQHFQRLPIWRPNTDLDLCNMNCMYLYQKDHPELTICTKQNKPFLPQKVIT